MMPWLSVLVPVYDVQSYLEECIGSIMEQISGDDDGVEVFLYDDASTDASGALARELVDRWPQHLHLLRGEHNRGLSVARNTLVDATRGEYLWFVDSDDKLLPGAMGTLRRIVQQHEPDVVLCDFQVWRDVSKIRHRLRGERHRRTFGGPARQLHHSCCVLLAGLLRKGRLHAWSKISRRTLWRGATGQPDLEFPPGRYYEDLSTMPLMALRARSFYYEPVPWIAYRQRADSILGTPSLAKALDQSSGMRDFSEVLRRTPCWSNSAIRIALAHQAARNLTGAMRVLFDNVARPASPSRLMDLADQVRRDFLFTSPLAPDELAHWYSRRGWWLRRRKFLHWFHARPNV